MTPSNFDCQINCTNFRKRGWPADIVIKNIPKGLKKVLCWKNHALRRWCGETRVTSYYLRVESLKAQIEIQKCNFKSTIWNSRVISSTLWVMSSNPRVTSLNPWVRSSKLRVTSSKLRVTSSNLPVASSNQGVQESFHQGKFK